MYIVLSMAFSSNDFLSMLKMLAVAALKLRNVKVASIKRETLTDKDRLAVVRVCKGLDLDPALGTDIYDNLLKGAVADAVTEFLPEFRKALNTGRVKHDPNTTTGATRDVLAPLLTLLNNPESVSAFSTLQKRIGGLNATALTQAYIGATKEAFDDPDTITTKLKSLVKKLAKIDGTTIPTEIINKIKTKYPDEIREYRQLKAALSISNSAVIRSAVAESGKKFITLKQLAVWLRKNGIKNSTIHPELFKSKFIGINLDGKLVDNRGVVLVGTYPQHSAKVTLNDSYNPDPDVKGNNWIYAVDTGKSVNRAQPEDIIAARRGDKFVRVSDSLDDIENMVSKWRSKMKLKGNFEDPKVVYPFFAEYLYQTASRVGSAAAGNTNGMATFGAGNFTVSAIKNRSASGPLHLRYPVKGGKLQDFVLNPAEADEDDRRFVTMLVSFMRKKAEGKDKTDVLFSIHDARINTGLFGKWLKATVGIKPHDFRSLRGTKIASEELPKATNELKKLSKKKTPSETEVNKIFDNAVIQVGKKLGHVRRAGGAESVTPNTAISYYINPKLMIGWYRDAGYAPSSKVRKAAEKSGIVV